MRSATATIKRCSWLVSMIRLCSNIMIASGVSPSTMSGRTVGYIECEIVSDGGKLIAKASSTCLVLRGEKSKQQ